MFWKMSFFSDMSSYFSLLDSWYTFFVKNLTLIQLKTQKYYWSSRSNPSLPCHRKKTYKRASKSPSCSDNFNKLRWIGCNK